MNTLRTLGFRKIVRSLFPVGLLLAVVAPLLGGSLIGVPFQVNTVEFNHQREPAVAMDAAGNFVMVWTSGQGAGGTGGISFRRYDVNGSPLDNQEVEASADGRDPAVGMDAAGNFVIAWVAVDEIDPLGDASNGVFARRFAANGTPQGLAFGVNASTAGDENEPAVGMSSGGNFAIAWTSQTVSPGVFVASFDANGMALGDANVGQTSDFEYHSQPAVAMDATGNFVVAWRIMHSPSFATEVVAARFDASGAFQAPRIPVSISTGEPLVQPAVGMDGTGNFVVAWAPRFGDVFAQRFDAAGALQGSQLLLGPPTSGAFPGSIAVASGAAGTFAVTWQGADSDDNALTAVACSDGSGFLIGPTASSSTSGRQTGVGLNAAGNGAVAWTGDADTSGLAIFAHRFACGTPAPTLSINDVSVSEGNSGTTILTFTVTLSAPSNQPVSVQYETAPDAAMAGSDYQHIADTLQFPANVTQRTFTVNINSDALNECDETFFVNLLNPSGATIANAQGVGSILNDDANLSINNNSVLEGDSGTRMLIFTVTLSPPICQPLTVHYITQDDAAKSGAIADYQSVGDTTLTFLPGDPVTQNVTVPVIGDTVNEADETFFVTLLDPGGEGILGNAQGVGTILNDDPLPSLSIDNVIITEGNSGTAAAFLNVDLSAQSGQTVTVLLDTADVNATANTDYLPFTSFRVTFAPGETRQRIEVTIVGDTTLEPIETLSVNLRSPGNATIARAQGVVTIADDDGNTPAGNSISVQPVDSTTGTAPITLTFAQVNQAGHTTLTTSNTGPAAPAGFQVGQPPVYYDLSTNVVFSGSITVCINYTGITLGQASLWHFENGAWTNVTTSVDQVNKIVCGVVTSLSPFALFQPTGGCAVTFGVEGLEPPLAELAPEGVAVPLPPRAFKAGSTLPLKLRLFCGSTLLTNADVDPPRIVALVRNGDAINLDAVDLDSGAANDYDLLFRFSGGNWIYNLSTRGFGTGAYLLTIQLADGRRFNARFVVR